MRKSNKEDIIRDRVITEANYIIHNNTTVRDAAKEFGVSKTTVHIDVVDRLAKINPMLYMRARDVLMNNKAERHLRGGLATKMKFAGMED